MGVINVMHEAMQHGFNHDEPQWANLGQGSPETGVISEAPPRRSGGVPCLDFFFCPGAGWIDIDPTNNIMPANHHIAIAWGRDYGDVNPTRGVILGSGEHSLKVAVDVIPLHEPRFPLTITS